MRLQYNVYIDCAFVECAVSRVRISDIAGKTGFSVATVSRVLNNHRNEYISKKTSEIVQMAARDLGYTPNRAARALVTGRSHVVALTVNALMPFQSYIAERVRDLAEQDGYELMLISTTMYQPHDAQSSPRAFFPVDGLLSLDAGPKHFGEVISKSFEASLPHVSLGFYYETDCDHVGLDWQLGLDQAIEHLLGSGRKRIALYPMTDTEDPHNRCYMNSVKRYGFYPEIAGDSWDLYKTRDTAAAYVQKHGCPDAFICVTDDYALAVYRGLLDIGIRVPEDVAIVGNDNTLYAQLNSCPISTIGYPIDEMCETAWRYLRNRMDNPDIPRQSQVYDSYFIPRMSTDPPEKP